MHYSDFQWWRSFVGGLCLLVLWSGCKTEVAEMKDIDLDGFCSQIRGTSSAPEPFAGMTNILPASKENLAAGKQLFYQDAKPIPCEICHRFKGNRFGVIYARMQPNSRYFTCYQTMKDVSDGQLYWIIKHGSHGTWMNPYKSLNEDEIWKLVHYVRHFAD